MNTVSRYQSFYQCLRLLFLATLVAILVLGGFQTRGLNASADNVCIDGIKINGDYECNGGCVLKTATGDLEFKEVSDEIDIVRNFEEQENFYEVVILGKNGFFEVEIGPLVGHTLRTSTAMVSDNIFPVLEDYVFETDGCDAKSFKKSVRNPSQENFKSCMVSCEKK